MNPIHAESGPYSAVASGNLISCEQNDIAISFRLSA